MKEHVLQNIKKFWFPVLLLIFIALTAYQPTTDNDLGWHLRQGEYFFTHGRILKENIISFVWPNFRWVQISWLYDLIAYQIYLYMSFLGLTIVSVAITLATFVTLTYPFLRQKKSAMIPLTLVFLSHCVGMYGMGLRDQTFSMLCFAIMLRIAFRQSLVASTGKQNVRMLFFLPLLFFVWANLHAGFAIGLILLTSYWIMHGFLLVLSSDKTKSAQSMSVTSWLVMGSALGLSYLTPLINPWGIGLYQEVLRHMTNTNLKVILEWEPLTTLTFETRIVALLFLVTAFLWVVVRRRRSEIPLFLVYCIVTFLTFDAIRFVMLFGAMTVFLLSQVSHTGISVRFRFSRLLLPVVVTGVLCLAVYDMVQSHYYFIVPRSVLIRYDWRSYCARDHTCSEELTDIMRKNPPVGNGYHPYDLGGYLSFRVPEVKTFIDGRMPAWEDQGRRPPVQEAEWVVSEKYPVNFRRLDAAYTFRWAILYAQSPDAAYLDTLVADGQWGLEYADANFRYYVKR